jgi:uncharacterized membrane protein YbhN (UPF0104 family)
MRKSAEAATAECLETASSELPARPARFGSRARTVLSYLAALAIIVAIARDVPLAALLGALARARIGLFATTVVLAFAGWFFGETLLFSRLFTYFHGRTTFRETLAANAAQYFLQLVNVAVGSGALIVFLKKRKSAHWLDGACTLLFQALIDFQVMIAMALAGLMIAPQSALRRFDLYLTAPLGALWLVAWFWMRGRPRTRWLQRIYDLPAMGAFRTARPRHYLSLSLIRAAIFGFQGFALYFEMRAFGLQIPLTMTLALAPVILLIASLPLTPVGLGSEQAAMVMCFRNFAAAADVLTVSLAISAGNMICRILLGLIFPHAIKSFDETL